MTLRPLILTFSAFHGSAAAIYFPVMGDSCTRGSTAAIPWPVQCETRVNMHTLAPTRSTTAIKIPHRVPFFESFLGM
ncbi:hypothetical protein QBC44DRAFT_322995 [Cladorrhinum sp. PSN332]|nr:hypothetical protein QBC44DRAFT_322995 [Cladorrhinum sp. PSN332]